MKHDIMAESWELFRRDREMQRLKQELLEEARKAAREEYAKEQDAFIMEQRVILAQLTAAANEAEKCAIRYQDNLDKYLR